MTWIQLIGLYYVLFNMYDCGYLSLITDASYFKMLFAYLTR